MVMYLNCLLRQFITIEDAYRVKSLPSVHHMSEMTLGLIDTHDCVNANAVKNYPWTATMKDWFTAIAEGVITLQDNLFAHVLNGKRDTMMIINRPE